MLSGPWEVSLSRALKVTPRRARFPSLVALPVAGPLCSASLVERILSDAWSNSASSVEMLVKRFGCNVAMRIWAYHFSPFWRGLAGAFVL